MNWFLNPRLVQFMENRELNSSATPRDVAGESLKAINVGLCLWFTLGIFFLVGLPRARAATPAALTGIVSSNAEGPMKGVVVSAKRVGGTVTVTVATDKG